MKTIKKLSLFIVLTMLLLSNYSKVYTQNNYGNDAYNYLKKINVDFQKRIAGGDKEKEMSQYIKQELSSFGYSPTIEPFSYERKGVVYDSENVIAIKKGNLDKQIIVGAHYDSVGTNGVDDNGSGVSVTLETAKKLVKTKTMYTLVFVFFGAEEVGLKGSNAYATKMSQEQKDKTILMVNLDSVLAGTYPYIYGGIAQDDGSIKDTWGVEQGLELSKKLNLGLKTNDTSLNYNYPTPSTGTWSDHTSFAKVGIPHIYLEASNWEVLDNVNKPENGSSGAAETEIGTVMHKQERDNLEFIEGQWNDRGQKTITTYSKFLHNYLQNVDPYKKNEPVKNKPLSKNKIIIKNNKTYYYILDKNNKYLHIKTVVKTKKTTNTKFYKHTTKKLLVSDITINKYNNKNVVTKSIKKSYYKNNKIKQITILNKTAKTNKYTTKYKVLYNKNTKKQKSVLFKYSKGTIKDKYEFHYNKSGQLKSSKKQKQAYFYKSSYNKGKIVKNIKVKYDSKGKKRKAIKSKKKILF